MEKKPFPEKMSIELQQIIINEIKSHEKNKTLDLFAFSLFCECMKWRSRFKFAYSFLDLDLNNVAWQVGQQFDRYKKLWLSKDLEDIILYNADPNSYGLPEKEADEQRKMYEILNK